MRITPERTMDALLKTLSPLPRESWDRIVDFFLNQVVTRGKKGDLTKMQRAVDERMKDGDPVVSITAAHEMDETFLRPLIERVLDIPTFTLQQTVEPRLAGGIRIECGMTIVRASLEDQLAQLKNFLRNE